jgi:hypothetical protein
MQASQQTQDYKKTDAEVLAPQWAELSPRALLDSMNTTRLRRAVPTAHILEESASEQSGDEDSGHVKHITISLGDCECRSDSSSHSPVSWSHNSDSAVWHGKITMIAHKVMINLGTICHISVVLTPAPYLEVSATWPPNRLRFSSVNPGKYFCSTFKSNQRLQFTSFTTNNTLSSSHTSFHYCERWRGKWVNFLITKINRSTHFNEIM